MSKRTTAVKKRPPLLDPPNPTVLFIDDLQGNRQAFQAAFRRDFKVLCAHSPASLWSLLGRNEVHVVIADQRMPGSTGCDILAEVRERYPRVRRMLATAYTDMTAVVDAMNRSGAGYYIQKPWDLDAVRAAVQRAVDEYHQEDEARAWLDRMAKTNRRLSDTINEILAR